MAYANTVTVLKKGAEVLVTITETEAGATSEPDAIDLGYVRMRLIKQECHLTAGTGTTVDPILGKATDPANATNADKIIASNGTAAANIYNQPATPVTMDITGVVYHRSQVDAAADNSITTTYHFLVGWK